ncbi:hypothetical protein SDC9_211216 [bioreactor metagenome]|uniref:Uncharacterized protein n=1 Tax=bioreactor metagenome TaxID=1076179 RepID=A0A645JJD0_9ZZZZ
MLHHAIIYARRFLPVQRQHREERAFAEAVGEAAAIGQRVPLSVKPPCEARRDEKRPLPELPAPRRVQFFHRPGVDEAVVMERPEGVVLPLVRIIKVPAVALVVGFD